MALIALRRSRQQTGFTLLELLVVIALIGLMSGAIMLTVGRNPAKALDDEARRLQVLMRMGLEEAMMLGVEYGVEVKEDEYAFLVFETPNKNVQEKAVQDAAEDALEEAPEASVIKPQWRIVSTPKQFRAHKLPDKMRMRLEIEDSDINLISKKNKEVGITAGPMPTLYLLSSGEMTPFDIEFYWENNTEVIYTVSGKVTGEVSLKRPTDEDEDDNDAV